MRLPLIALFGAGLSACSFELPEGPDLSELASEYDHPDGLLNEENVETIVKAARATLERIDQFSSLDFVIETLSKTSDSVQGFSKATPGTRFSVDLASQTVAPCPGIAEDHESGSGPGHFVMDLVVEASQLRPTIWGNFDACQLDPGGVPVELDATLQIYLDGDLALTSLEVKSYLFKLAGEIRIDGEEDEGQLDFRLFSDRALELRIPSDTGHIVMGFQAGEVQEASVRTADESFCCHFDERRCAQVSGDSCSSPETGDEEIRW